MKPITIFFAVVLAVAGFGAGILVGRQSGKKSSGAGPAIATTEPSSPAQKLPAVKVKARPATAGPDKNEKPAKYLTLAEVDAALAELKGLSRNKLWERVSELAKGVAPADIAHVMALLT